MKYRKTTLEVKRSGGKKSMMFRPLNHNVEREILRMETPEETEVKYQSDKVRRIVKRITNSPFIHIDA